MIELMRREDWECVRAVYAEGLETGDATFETEAPTWERWDASHLAFARLVELDLAHLEGLAWRAEERRARLHAGTAAPSALTTSSVVARSAMRVSANANAAACHSSLIVAVASVTTATS